MSFPNRARNSSRARSGSQGSISKVERLDACELGPVPRHLGDGAPLRGQQRAVDLLEQRRRPGREAEPLKDGRLEPVFGLGIVPAQLASVLEGMREIDEVRLRGVMEQSPELRLDVTPSLADQIRDGTRVLRDRVVDPAVATEPALVRERTSDIADVDVARIGVERVESAAAHGLDVRDRLPRSERNAPASS